MHYWPAYVYVLRLWSLSLLVREIEARRHDVVGWLALALYLSLDSAH